MPTPSERLEDIKESLDDLPERLAAVLENNAGKKSLPVPTAALSPPAIQRLPPTDAPTAAPAPGSPPPPIPQITESKPPPLPVPTQQPPDLPRWWEKAIKPKQEQPVAVRDWDSRARQQQEEKGKEDDFWKDKIAEGKKSLAKWSDDKPAAVPSPGETPKPPTVPASTGTSSTGGKSDVDFTEVADLLTDILDELKKANDRRGAEGGPEPQRLPPRSPGFKTVYEADEGHGVIGGKPTGKDLLGAMRIGRGAGGPRRGQ